MRIWRATTFRFAALVFSLQIVGALVLLGFVLEVTRKQITDDATTIARVARDDLVAVARRDGFRAMMALARDRTARRSNAGAVLLVVDATGRPLAGNLGAWPPTVQARTGTQTIDLFRVGRERPERMRVTATRFGNGARLLTGAVIERELRVTELIEEAMASAVLIALAFGAFAAWAATRLIIARLRATVQTVHAVRDGDLQRRVPEDGGGDAFEALARSVNAMLDRIAALLAELRIATDGLAHDLKSPLTRLQSALERAAIEVREPVAQASVDRALNESARLLALVETALRISRAEAGIGVESFVPTDLAEQLHQLAEIYEPVAEDAGFAITVDAPVTDVLPVHRELLGQALANLIDNAMKYGASAEGKYGASAEGGGRIALSLARTAEGVTIAVADRGPGIAPGQRAEALRRFGRLDEARGGAGAGLGLSLVAAVAKLHGGAMTLGDAAPGLIVAIRLPRR